MSEEYFELTPEMEDWMLENMNKSPSDLILTNKKFENATIRKLVTQIDIRQRAKLKLRSWVSNSKIIFPSKLAYEQSTSEMLAIFKAEKFGRNELIIDGTGGLGMDSFGFSKYTNKVCYVEQNANLCKHAAHNFSHLGINNIEIFNENIINFLKNTNTKANLIYLDPARRDDADKKVIDLIKYTPDIIENMQLLFQHTDTLLVKLSPMVDLTYIEKSLTNIEEIVITGIADDCKEILVKMNKKQTPITYTAVEFSKQGELKCLFSCSNVVSETTYSMPQTYIYELFTPILKLGKFNHICSQFFVSKLHKNTHIFTSSKWIDNFPGNVFELQETTSPKIKEIKILKDQSASITTYNYPEKPEILHKKWKIKNGNDFRIFGVKLINEEYKLLICKPIIKK